ncbi:2-dehydro-3-deoxygalactonokinase [Spirosoma radiotolerans]|uniref:2-keto-3-deoxy-galactonokinase n=1 Tax=Spirosoma radiotolerans TaxID=1379870 RepID=A0A0E3V657_9BACT|nr:2-dehydro-3-deoxygalactonokinase [Spirosoma radiotolerans]AKD54241.1 2-keto-3-deoxy-galactonokinase [Spirosoma radiotolerans]
MKNHLLGCDWGTSSFRLRLIDSTDLRLISEVTSQEGVASTFSDWKANGESQGVSREHFFRQQLKRQVDWLASKTAIDLTGTPIVISGMASSSIGMEEVPYATLPFPTDGSLASTRQLSAQADFPHDLTLISGVRTQDDVMRGEETQLIGLLDLLDTLQMSVDESILLFPGTHSKHIYIQQQQVTDFRTFMTGELFNLMAYHSILKDSVEPTDLHTFSDSDLTAFTSGINDADSSILNALFRVRTNQLFNKLSKKQNALYLSGLLIGDELKTLIKQPKWQLILCSGNNLYELYKLAMEVLQLSDRTTTISANLIDKATMAGQLKIAQNQHVLLPK